MYLYTSEINKIYSHKRGTKFMVALCFYIFFSQKILKVQILLILVHDLTFMFKQVSTRDNILFAIK